jgi:hypothetical protein
VGQLLVFGWFWSWRTFNTRLARRKLGKKNTPPTWRPPLPYGRHGAPPPATLYTTISQHDAQQVYVVKTRGYYCFYYLLALEKAQRVVHALCLCLPVAAAASG